MEVNTHNTISNCSQNTLSDIPVQSNSATAMVGKRNFASLFNNLDFPNWQKNVTIGENQVDKENLQKMFQDIVEIPQNSQEIISEPQEIEKVNYLYSPKNKVTSFAQLTKASAAFNSHSVIPTLHNQIKNIGKNPDLKKEIVEHANAVRPILPYKVLELMTQFLDLKKAQGTSVEKKLYAEMDVYQLVDRLLKNRPLMFLNKEDFHLLKGETQWKWVVGAFESIGTEKEKVPYTLENYISYDEMAISALMSVSVPTHFINMGDRENHGVKGKEGTFEEKGVYVGLVGARFEKPGLMEYRHMMIDPKQNTPQNGYGPLADPKNPKTQLLKIWENFYGESFPTYEEAKNDNSGKYILLENGKYMHRDIYKKRMRSTIEPFLIDANDRAKAVGKKAYIHAVGLGLGAWFVHLDQQKIQLQVYEEVMADQNLSHISDINFSHFYGMNLKCGSLADSQYFKNETNEIKIHFSKRNPAEKLVNEDEGKLLVASYAWDGNSYPGNEYWDGHLSASGDPAAACCSTIPELQNPEINPSLCSDNLFITNPS